MPPRGLLMALFALASCSTSPKATPDECEQACTHLAKINFRSSGRTRDGCLNTCQWNEYTAQDTACILGTVYIDEAEQCMMRADDRHKRKLF